MKRKKDNIDDAIHYCYCELFNNSTPQGDFNELVKNATINKRGEKVIPFDDYNIEHNKLDEIIMLSIKKFKIPKRQHQLFKNTILLGCSPKTIKTI